MQMKQVVLVTGGAGYIGSHTVVELQNSGYDVVIVDNFSNSQSSVVENIGKITGITPKLYSFDLADEKACTAFFHKEHIDAIIHFAAYKYVGESVEQPLRYYKNNLYSTLNLLTAMKEHHIKQLVFSSSSLRHPKCAYFVSFRI